MKDLVVRYRVASVGDVMTMSVRDLVFFQRQVFDALKEDRDRAR